MCLHDQQFLGLKRDEYSGHQETLVRMLMISLGTIAPNMNQPNGHQLWARGESMWYTHVMGWMVHGNKNYHRGKGASQTQCGFKKAGPRVCPV